MNPEQQILLSKMKRLIKNKRCRFEKRKDRDYNDDLYEIGITEHDAWYKHIIYLQEANYVIDYKPIYYKDKNSLVFKKRINNIIVYIKLKIEINKETNEECVCLSFHKDRR